LLSEVVKKEPITDSPGTQAVLKSFVNAISGKDAVRAKGESCRGQLRLFFEYLDPMSAEPGNTAANKGGPTANSDFLAVEAFRQQTQKTSLESGGQLGSAQRQFGATQGQFDARRRPLDREILKNISNSLQVLDHQLRIAEDGGRTFPEHGGILISGVEAGTVYVSLLAGLFGGAELIDYFLATDPGGNTYTLYRSVPPSVIQATPPLQLTCPAKKTPGKELYCSALVATGGVPPYTFSISKISVAQEQLPPDPLQLSDSGAISSTLPDDFYPISFTAKVKDSAGSEVKKSCTITLTDAEAPGLTPADLPAAAQAAAASAPAATGPESVAGLQGYIGFGTETRMVLFLRPPAAHVRCFSYMEGDDCCGQGKQYISRVAISALQGDNFIECRQTGDSGCSGFTLNPGWYHFLAPRDITIAGCNYTLASSSPVSALLGAGQVCSDIYFSYKKKGNEIEVISEISSALGGDPYVPAKENFPGMQYLLLSESDPTFVPQQQTTATGGAVYFRNLAAGTYMLFCQAPATYGSQPVTPVYPADGRLALRVFAGQTSRVPVLVKFRTTTTDPAVLDGYVRDDTGQPIPQQVVQVMNNANSVVAAGLTDANGYYSIQIYSAENLTIVVGTQQMAVSKSQIQMAMKTVGTPPLPSPGATLDLAVQTSEIARSY